MGSDSMDYVGADGGGEWFVSLASFTLSLVLEACSATSMARALLERAERGLKRCGISVLATQAPCSTFFDKIRARR